MRKFNKKKGSRRGAILVTVVFILAFAMIFIAAAMMLTQSTRKRVYTEAENNQARLTVTSVAEAWYRAIKKAEFEDDDILAICSANSGSGTTIRVKASATADTIPGLENEGTTNNESYTTVKFYRSPNVAGATNDEQFTYYADFSTHIDGQVENVRAALTYTPPLNPSGGKPFDRQVDYNGVFKQSNLKLVGDGKANDLDNVFLVRKGGKNENSGFSSTATMVYCDGDVAFKDDKLYSDDIVFLKGARLAKLNDSTNPSVSPSNWFFFGDNGESIASGSDKGNFNPAGKTFYLCKRTDNTSWTNSNSLHNVIYINADGSRADGGADLNNSFKKKIQKYASYNASYKKGGTEAYPTTDSFLSSMKSSIRVGKTAPSSKDYNGSMGNWLKANCYQTKNGYAQSGDIYFNSDGCDQSNTYPGLSGEKEPYIIVLDGSKTYHFWFASGKSFHPKHVVFIVVKPSPSNPALFLLERNAKLYWPGKPSNNTDSDGTLVGNNGILAVQGRNNIDSAAEGYKYVHDQYALKKDNGATNFENTANYGYSKHYNHVNEPCAMIIGMGENTVKFDKNIILECFIGLFNDEYNDNGSAKSKLIFRNGDSGVLYGRIMTDGYDDADGGSIVNPACPGSSSFNGSTPDMTKVVTCFSLKSMVYYYNLGSNNQTGG